MKQTLVKNIGCLAGILPEGTERLCGKQMAILNTIENAWLLIEDGRIKDFGEAPFPCPQGVEASETTVIDAEYISPDFSEFEKIGAFQYACKVPPEYHIRYKFNPPDDDNPNDLIRTYISSKPPQLQPGDTIPILYNINRDEHNHITDVTSMPFPIPLQDVATIDRIISSKDS